MLLSNRSFTEIEFPIFPLTPDYRKIWEEFNVLYIQTNSGIYILDNKNLSGNTLGERRLKIKNVKRYTPRKAYYNITQLIKSKYKTYIDNTGCVFTYKKTRIVPLKYYKVKDVVSTDAGCILSIKDVNFKLRTNCRDAYAINYVGLLETNMGYILYDTSEEFKRNSTRKI